MRLNLNRNTMKCIASVGVEFNLFAYKIIFGRLHRQTLLPLNIRMPNAHMCFCSKSRHSIRIFSMNAIASRVSRIMLLKYVQSIQLKYLRCISLVHISFSMCSKAPETFPSLCSVFPYATFIKLHIPPIPLPLNCIFDYIHEMKSTLSIVQT